MKRSEKIEKEKLYLAGLNEAFIPDSIASKITRTVFIKLTPLITQSWAYVNFHVKGLTEGRQPQWKCRGA